MAEPRVVNAADFPSLQVAVDALPPGGGEIFLPPGNYELSEDLVIDKVNVTLRGCDEPAGGAVVVDKKAGRAAKIRVKAKGFQATNLKYVSWTVAAEAAGRIVDHEEH